MNRDIFVKIGKIESALHWVEKSQLIDFAHEVNVLFLEEKILFRILEANSFELTVRITQGKPENLPTKSTKELSLVAKNLFGKYFPYHQIQTRAIPYREIPAKEIRPVTIKTRLKEQGISLNQIARETGIPRAQIYDWVQGVEPLNAVTRAMFYYMLK
ncbi:helix-turn-helix protein [Algoriphagus boseongensis]|uniref:Helix-turn-helix protein n=1 Tax=Algoriphagus boseongensis TaxID=1442587 RepID=A0A4R6T5C0_9BACT|nr:helix-turn-helix transcriptional regulator [Algoriphagus boseongensis]TDQ16902.1 helix-turn-helix protein [Algoriphagus boseongensis]